jgi:hypothetical protein
MRERTDEVEVANDRPGFWTWWKFQIQFGAFSEEKF